MTVDPSVALSVAGVSKRFGSVVALDGADFTVRRGTVHALLGENGAGKTTLMRLVYGLSSPDAGTIALFGHAHASLDTRTARAAGVGMVQQHLSIAPNLTASENIALGNSGIFRPARARAQLASLMAATGLHVRADEPAGEFSVVERQRLEILKALARDARLLIFDEPTTGLAPSEIDDVLAWIRTFAEGGGAVVLVTHKLREARAVADDVTVLRRGRVVLSARTAEVTNDELALAMFPDTTPDSSPQDVQRGVQEVIVTANGIGVVEQGGSARLRDASFTIRRGEIVGIAGVEGSGHRLLMQALAGLHSPAQGSLTLPERIAIVPADRVRDAIVPEFSLVDNVALRNAGARRGRMPWRDLRERTGTLIAQFDIVAQSVEAPASSLSGGNQQRLVVARELEHAVDLVVADNPTRGLDLRAVTFVHDQLRAAATRGAGIVVHASDLDELLGLVTRVLVVFDGRVIEVPRDREAIGRAMVGA